jgi:hypothetical protein
MILLAGIVLGQVILYGPSLAGRAILLPLDILARPTVYLPQTPEVAGIGVHNLSLSDLIYVAEPMRRFAATEFRAGRLPMWTPWNFAGAPFIWPKFSPFFALQSCTASPVVLAWSQLLAAIVVGVGAYLFCQRVLAVSFWPGAIAAWCYPLTAFFVLWQGFGVCVPVYWLPWVLLAVNETARRTSPLAPLGLSIGTALVLTSGQLDVGAQVLLVAGLYGLWCLYDAYPGQWLQRQARKAVLSLVLGWGLGILLAAPYVLPVLEYTHAGARMVRRSAGQEERPPVGLRALPEIVLPDFYGADGGKSVRFGRDPQPESAAAAYAGLVATLLFAPLAWCSRRHRRINVFCALLLLASLSWCLNIPGFVSLLRLPGLNMMSHNRLVFASSFAVLAMSAVGIEVLRQGPVPWRWWLWLPPALLAGFCALCLYRAMFLPEPIDTQLGTALLQGFSPPWIHDLEGVRRVQLWFEWHYFAAAGWCGLTLFGWWLLRCRPLWQSQILFSLGVLLVGELLWFAHDRRPQCDPALYFPPVSTLEQIARSAPGRIIGVNCLPASLASVCGLRDIRGYDAVDPARLVELTAAAGSPQSRRHPYALTQWLSPDTNVDAQGKLTLSPVLDMLGVRYVIGRGVPPPTVRPAYQEPDYWVLVNSNALARAYVPKRVQLEADADARLNKLISPLFDPREVAYVETALALPASCRGRAKLVSEIPTRIKVALQMETAGLVVLADLWDRGWRAYLNGKSIPIVRANHAIRGVAVPAGEGMLEFRYEPASFTWGLRLATLATALLGGWVGMATWNRRSAQRRECRQTVNGALVEKPLGQQGQVIG